LFDRCKNLSSGCVTEFISERTNGKLSFFLSIAIETQKIGMLFCF